MRRVVFAAFVLFAPGAIAGPTATERSMTTSHNEPEFAARLHGELKTKSGNLFYSPVSVQLALAMAQAGARGETLAEMKRVVGMGDNPAPAIAKLRADWEALANPKLRGSAATSNDPMLQRYAEEEREARRLTLRVVNRLWGEKSRTFRDEFLALLRDSYGAPMEQLDFRNAPEPSRVAINEWVSAQTQKKIENLIPPGVIDPATKLVITNAVYFKGSWTHPFNDGATQRETFYTPKGQAKVPMMHVIEHFNVAHVDNALVLEMPYGDGELAMNVVLPDKRDGLADVEKRFAAGAFADWTGKLASRRVDVALPSFKVQTSLELAEALAAMGATRAFKFPDADFSGMDGTHELFISRVIHQAYVAVDEKGTEAAAATALAMVAGSAPVHDEPLHFHADHPFMVLIRDTRSGVILFVGRIVDPSTQK